MKRKGKIQIYLRMCLHFLLLFLVFADNLFTPREKDTSIRSLARVVYNCYVERDSIIREYTCFDGGFRNTYVAMDLMACFVYPASVLYLSFSRQKCIVSSASWEKDQVGVARDNPVSI